MGDVKSEEGEFLYSETLMKYHEEVITSSGIICARVSGRIEMERLAILGKQTRQQAHARGLKFLLDLTQATCFPSLFEAHNWFNDYYDNLELHLKLVPTVHLCSPSEIKLFSFVETSWTETQASQGVQLYPDLLALLN